MSQAPKISIASAVRDRLRAVQAKSASHPDANLLSAFAENGLNPGERAQVMEHLAGCAGCREILTLAMPQNEDEAVAAAAPRSFRAAAFSWRATRWTALAASAAVLVAVVFLYRVQPAHGPTGYMAERASVKTAAPSAAPTVAGNHPTKNAQSESQSQSEEKIAATIAADNARKLPVASKEKAVERDKLAMLKSVPSVRKDEVADAKMQATPMNAIGSGLAQKSEAASRISPLAGGIVSQQQQLGQPSSLGALRAQDSAAIPTNKQLAGGAGTGAGLYRVPESKVASASGATTAQAAQTYNMYELAPVASNSASSPAAPAEEGKARAAVAKPSANLSNADRSESSKTDQIAVNKKASAPLSTNETVEVTAATPLRQNESANLAQLNRNTLDGTAFAKTGGFPSAPALPIKWRVHGGRIQRSLDGGGSWNDVVIPNAAGFHTVSAAGNQVWAGGSGAVLYHSSDGGATWTVQWSYARDASAQDVGRYPKAPANITKIDVSDGVNGAFWVKVGGSTPQTFLFTSNDGGKNWYEETID